jgi:hypothetical protein
MGLGGKSAVGKGSSTDMDATQIAEKVLEAIEQRKLVKVEYGYEWWFTPEATAVISQVIAQEVATADRAQVIAAWSEAERRMGKFVNLDDDTVKGLIGCPLRLLDDVVRSKVGAM